MERKGGQIAYQGPEDPIHKPFPASSPSWPVSFPLKSYLPSFWCLSWYPLILTLSFPFMIIIFSKQSFLCSDIHQIITHYLPISFHYTIVNRKTQYNEHTK